tara:strand:+ start:1938 stop:3737 length:1800 start_codon:yes stop_codon:yes gene_type:complete
MLHLLTHDKVLCPADLERLRSLPYAEYCGVHPINCLDQQGCQINNDKSQKGDQSYNTEQNRYFKLPHILTWLAELAGQTVVTIDPLAIEREAATQLISYEYACQHNIFALQQKKESLVIVSCEPFLSVWESELEHIHQKKIIRLLANPEDVSRYREQFYQLEKVVLFAEKNTGQPASHSLPIASATELLCLNSATIDLKPVIIDSDKKNYFKKIDEEIDQQHIVSIVDWLFKYAFDQRASDIHLEPRQPQSNIRFRIDGYLYTVYQLPHEVMTAVISRLKVVAGMDLAEKRKAQDGRIAIHNYKKLPIELRIATLPTVAGEKIVVRIFDQMLLQRSFSNLGLSEKNNVHWQTIIQQRSGIILISGPTGSGKTTTLYKTLHSLATSRVNVCSIEDPVEMVVPSMNQMQVNKKIQFGFASGVRALMRQDPDIIMIGEIRDSETASMAIQAALTGHLVLSTIHTDDACSVLSRLLDLGQDAYLIRATLIGVMAQRLVRVLCPYCKNVNSNHHTTSSEPTNAATSVGCKCCRNSGYLGREGIYEILDCNNKIKACITLPFDLAAFKQQAVLNGMQSLVDAGKEKISRGLTTKDELHRVLAVSI